MTTEKIIVIVVGLALGLAVAYINSRITRKTMMSNNAGVLMGTNGLRMLLDLAALALGYFGGNYLELPLFPLLISIAVGLSIGGIVFLKIMLNKFNKQTDGKPNTGESFDNKDNQERGE